MKEQSVSDVWRIADRARGELLHRWWDLSSDLSDDLQRYSLQERLARGRHLERTVDQLVAEAQNPPQSLAAMAALRERMVSGGASFVRSGLGWGEDQVARLTDPALAKCLMAFGRRARAFDKSISPVALYQAGRNVAVMHGAQMLLGLPVELTPAMVGYSLLYPYSDNMLDDPALSPESKREASKRLGQWLVGNDPSPATQDEERIRSLVAMIDADLPRADYADVWDSLRLIHKGQVDSVRLVNEDASPYELDVLRLTIAKGGASVLADGYLVAAAHGGLNADWARSLFDWGAILQLVDDMQDVQEDMSGGVQTVFSQTAVTWPLDGVANRAINLVLHVFDEMSDVCGADGASTVALMRDSVVCLIVDAIAATRRLYSRPYVLAVEDCSPFPFLALSRARRRLERQRPVLLSLVESLVNERATTV